MTTTFLSVLKNSATRLMRRRSFWIIQGLLSILPLLISILGFLTGAIPLLSGGKAPPGLFTLALYYLVIPILAGSIILEDFGKIGDVLWSTRLDSLAHFAGVFCGLWLALAAGSLIQLGSWFLADLFWINVLTEWAWLVSLAVHLLAVTLALSFTFLLAVLVRRTLPLLLSSAALWVWIYLSVVFTDALSEGFTPLRDNAYTNIFFHNLALSPSLGLGFERAQVAGMFAWFLGLSLAALGAALLFSHFVDSRRASRRAVYFPMVAVVGMLAAAGGYWLNGRAVAAHALPPSPLSIQADVWDVLSQRTQIEVDASKGTIAGSTALQLSPGPALAASEIVLRLNSGLSVTAASDGAGQTVDHRRVGDSVIFSLAEFPQLPVTINLTWQGELHIPYTVFQQRWRHPDAPYPYGFTHMPQALQGYVGGEAGFLLRDGDWKPWPWSTTTHQAHNNHLEIRLKGGEAAASVPIQNGLAVWDGSLPEGLVVFLPAERVEMGEITVAYTQLSSQQHIQQAVLFASSAKKLASLFGISAPHYMVVSPYLSNLIWSGDILLVPDGSGHYQSRPLSWLYSHDGTGAQQSVLARTSLATLARAYLLNRITPPHLELKPSLKPAGKPREIADALSVDEQIWIEDNGHWVQKVEVFDVDTSWNPRRVLSLSNQGKWAVFAFWLALELTDDTTRQADLDLLAYFAGEGKPERNFNNDQFKLASDRIWPDTLEVPEARQMVWQLHEWAENLGTREALSLVVEVIQEEQPLRTEELIAGLERRSGVNILEEQP